VDFNDNAILLQLLYLFPSSHSLRHEKALHFRSLLISRYEIRLNCPEHSCMSFESREAHVRMLSAIYPA